MQQELVTLMQPQVQKEQIQFFSTITSAGGGAGYVTGTGGSNLTGGSGGGVTSSDNDNQFPYCGAAGNTPPTDPPQGNPGGSLHPDLRDGYPYDAAGGGGATAAGGQANSGSSGAGGAGAPNTILGPDTTYAGVGAEVVPSPPPPAPPSPWLGLCDDPAPAPPPPPAYVVSGPNIVFGAPAPPAPEDPALACPPTAVAPPPPDAS